MVTSSRPTWSSIDKQADPAVRFANNKILEYAVSDGVHAVAEADSSRAGRHCAVGYRNVFAEAGIAAVNAGYADSIVAADQLAVGYVYVTACLEVEAVVIGNDGIIYHLYTVDVNVNTIGEI